MKPISILQTLQEEEMGMVTGKLPEQGQQATEEQPQPLSNGRVEDRGSNAFNMKEAAAAKVMK
jgi:hypothetical protein